VGEPRGDRILTLQGQLLEDGIRASIRKICSVLEYNRSNLYYSTRSRRKRLRPEDEWLEKEIRAVIDVEPEYGTRRITAVLRRKHGPTINHKRVHRIVKDRGWQRWKRPYGERPRVKGMRSSVATPNTRWAIDMTHLFTKRDGWCHLVAVIDCHDRYLVGWRFSRSGTAGIPAGALEDALIREHLVPGSAGLVIRSDNGLVFGSKRFHETIRKYRLDQEYITPYTPEQNGMIERFFRSLKEECVWQGSFVTFDEAYDKIAGWIDHYNRERPHSALGYATPSEIRHGLVA
jgi:putative transposase